MSDEKPLVTFALFAYNQERYVREAVESAFAQDYPSLEIIISDDGSTDETFQIISDLVSRYRGPHRVLARQTAANRGSLRHVAEVAGISRGDLLVLAAGDDVSKPNRVGVLQRAWAESGAWGLCSRFDRISADGALLAENVRSPVIDRHGFERYFFQEDGPVHVVHGCTSAYDSRVFQHLHLTPADYILAEDGAISVLLGLLGKNILHVDESLVLYRESPGSLTNSSARRSLSFDEIDRDEGRIERFARAQANRSRYFKRIDAALCDRKVRALNIQGVEAELLTQDAMANWYRMPVFRRLSFLRRGDVPVGWGLPRLVGRKTFYLAKWMASRIR